MQLVDFMDKARMGEPLPTGAVIRMARLFKDELTLDNVSRSQLVTMCQFMGITHYGTDTFLRFQVILLPKTSP
jgi:LETM1 and EF-hand domain-containing protein 1